MTRTDFTRPEQVHNIVAAIEEKRVRYVFWDSENLAEGASNPEEAPAGPIHAFLRRWYRAARTIIGGDYLPMGDHLAPLRNDLHAHYHVAQNFPSTLEVWERNN